MNGFIQTLKNKTKDKVIFPRTKTKAVTNDLGKDLDTLLKELETKFDNLKKSVSDGKSLLATSITKKKVPTQATDTFTVMASNIDKIKLGSGNAQPGDVLSGKTFTNDTGTELTGNMSNRGNWGTTINPGGSVTIPSGYHGGSGVVRANLPTFRNNKIWSKEVLDGDERYSYTFSGHYDAVLVMHMTQSNHGVSSSNPNSTTISAGEHLVFIKDSQGHRIYQWQTILILKNVSPGQTVSGTLGWSGNVAIYQLM